MTSADRPPLPLPITGYGTSERPTTAQDTDSAQCGRAGQRTVPSAAGALARAAAGCGLAEQLAYAVRIAGDRYERDERVGMYARIKAGQPPNRRLRFGEALHRGGLLIGVPDH